MIVAELGPEFERLVHALNRFADFRKKLKTSGLRLMAKTHKQQIRDRILTKKSGPDGEAWAPLSQKTIEAKRRAGTLGGGILIAKRKLVNSFKVAFTSGKGQLGSSLPYAAVHQYGWKERNIPARPYAGVGRSDIRKLQSALDTWVERNHPFR